MQESWNVSEESRVREALIREPPAVFREEEPEGPCPPAHACLAKCCTCLCCCSLLCPLLAYLWLMLMASFTVYGTDFTFFNYIIPAVDYLRAGMADNVSLTEWYNDITDGNPLVGKGPGPNTLMYYGWSDVKAVLMDFGPRIKNRTMKRYNELGITIQNSVMWPETGTIALGYSNADHSIVRPFLGDVLDAAGMPDRECDGSTCWNAEWLRSVFRKRLAAMDVLASTDLKWIITAVLHKIHLNLDISDEDAKNFAQFMTLFTVPQPLPPDLAASWPVQLILDITGVLRTKAVLMDSYREAIKKKWPEQDWAARPKDLVLLASAMCDSLALAGGLSVPSALDFMLALLFMQDSPAAPLKPEDLSDVAVLHDFMLETLRRFPPVAGVPRWITDDGGTSWLHEIPNVGQALQDPNVFREPLDFVPGRPGLNHQDQNLSIGWADFALVGDDVSHPDSHSCPGKQLSVQIMAAFLREFAAAGPWEAESAAITLNMYSSSGFNLRKRRPAGAAEEASAARAAGSHVGLVPAKPYPHPAEPPALAFWHWMPNLCRWLTGFPEACLQGNCAFT